jgi:flagellar biosynthesis chaperone FliJ
LRDYQKAVTTFRNLYARQLVPLTRARRERAAAIRLQAELVREVSDGSSLVAQLRRVQRRISTLDEDIHEFSEFSTEVRKMLQAKRARLNTVLNRSLYGTWLKASTKP